MKAIIQEIRMYLAEKILILAMRVSPNNSDGEIFVRSGINYFEKVAINKVFNGE
jgi:hypothetical protein